MDEITAEALNPEEFIKQKVDEISGTVGDGLAINALSGGVDSSAVTMLGHRALGDRLKTYFIDNGIMRQGEPERIVSVFKDLGVHVEVIDARTEFFDAMRGIRTPKRSGRRSPRRFTGMSLAGSLRRAEQNTSCRGRF